MEPLKRTKPRSEWTGEMIQHMLELAGGDAEENITILITAEKNPRPARAPARRSAQKPPTVRRKARAGTAEDRKSRTWVAVLEDIMEANGCSGDVRRFATLIRMHPSSVQQLRNGHYVIGPKNGTLLTIAHHVQAKQLKAPKRTEHVILLEEFLKQAVHLPTLFRPRKTSKPANDTQAETDDPKSGPRTSTPPPPVMGVG